MIKKFNEGTAAIDHFGQQLSVVIYFLFFTAFHYNNLLLLIKVGVMWLVHFVKKNKNAALKVSLLWEYKLSLKQKVLFDKENW